MHERFRDMPAESFAWHAQVCRGKRAYKSKKKARDYAKWFSKEHGHRQSEYRCPVCKLYHLKTDEKP